MENTRNFKKYYLGLDMGTNSVGWAVTDEEYKLQKFRGNLMWGVHLFDEANHANERRAFRTSRRRYDRRQQRIKLLQEFFAAEILKKDENFFMRLKESALFPEDSKSRTSNIYFDDNDYSDKDYYDEYPTIHHLIVELMKNKQPHDIRLVYLACAYILAHRGHFLSEIDADNIEGVKDFQVNYDNFLNALNDLDDEIPFELSSDDLQSVLKENIGITEKKKRFWNLINNGKAPKNDEENTINYEKLFSLMSGSKNIELSKLFNKEEYESLEKNKITISSADLSDTIDELEGSIDSEEIELIKSVKALYDWSLLVDSLKNCDYLSEAKVRVYDEHKEDLKNLKYIVKTYCKEEYDEIFRRAKKDNYVSYSYNTKDLAPNDKSGVEKCKSQADFCKFIKSKIGKMDVSPEDQDMYDKLMKKCELESLCPKQVTSDNRVIPYQLYYAELKKILDNASGYFGFLNQTDEYGSVSDKILSIMRFRIPYYVGPLVKRNDEDNCWVVRKEGKIYPWNFNDMVDHEESEKNFIDRMVGRCTYLHGENVLPKNSLLYSKFTVLNEINKININGEAISVQTKQKMYEDLFVSKNKKVTKKAIADYLISVGVMDGDLSANDISGVDDNLKSQLKSYHDFKRLLSSATLSEENVEDIIEHITVTTDTKRLKTWLKKKYDLSDEDIKYISKLKYKDYGRLSRRLLEEVWDIDSKTGEVTHENIITKMWNNNINLMELLGNEHGYANHIIEINDEYYSKKPVSIDQRMKDMYLSPAVRRSIIRTLEIAKEIKKIQGSDPTKIFIEMPREQKDESKKGKRTVDRKEQIKSYYESIKKEYAKDVSELEKNLDSIDVGKLRSEKYFLYFMQLGKCMYTGKDIDFESIGNDSLWNVDHIFPQAKVKDDSLDNKVLVDSNENGKKGDNYPIDKAIQDKMKETWRWMYKTGLISQKKYTRLMRHERFTDKELADFIERQLVETRQSTKAAAKLLQEVFPDSKLVYVKAGIVSDFRKETQMFKCREINDLHHAKDAYLNIVLGNVYNAYFTENPLKFVAEKKNYSLKIFEKDSENKTKGLLKRTIERNGKMIWNPKESFATVEKMMSKNSIRYVRYTYIRKGGFFDQNPKAAKEGLIPRKSSGENQPLLDTSKYGGYNRSTSAGFSVVKYGDTVLIIPVELLHLDSFINDESFAKEYAAEQIKIIKNKEICPDDILFPMKNRIIKINTLVDINGFRANITGKGSRGKILLITSAESLILGKKHYNYVKALCSYMAKSKNGSGYSADIVPAITTDRNIELFDLLCEKLNTKPFANLTLFANISTKFNKEEKTDEKQEPSKREMFMDLDKTNQVKVLVSMVELFKTGRSTGCDLSLLEEGKRIGEWQLGSTLKWPFRIIDQSPTGLFEKRSENLLDL